MITELRHPLAVAWILGWRVRNERAPVERQEVPEPAQPWFDDGAKTACGWQEAQQLAAFKEFQPLDVLAEVLA